MRECSPPVYLGRRAKVHPPELSFGSGRAKKSLLDTLAGTRDMADRLKSTNREGSCLLEHNDDESTTEFSSDMSEMLQTERRGCGLASIDKFAAGSPR